jgi:hypothetical protein
MARRNESPEDKIRRELVQGFQIKDKDHLLSLCPSLFLNILHQFLEFTQNLG